MRVFFFFCQRFSPSIHKKGKQKTKKVVIQRREKWHEGPVPKLLGMPETRHEPFSFSELL